MCETHATEEVTPNTHIFAQTLITGPQNQKYPLYYKISVPQHHNSHKKIITLNVITSVPIAVRKLSI